jgi:hypothetical protein
MYDDGGLKELLPFENGPVCNDPNAPQYYVMRTFPTVLRAGRDCSMSLGTAAINGPIGHVADDIRRVVH